MKGQSNKVLLIVFGIVILIMGISLINSNRARTYSNTSVTVVSEAADGLDLEALLELVKEARSAEDLEKALNEQLNFELYSAYIYYSMAAYFESVDLPGFANWMQIQYQEELFHVQKFFDFINERDGRVTLGGVDAPQHEWESPLAAFQNAYEHEKIVSKRIHELVDLSRQEKDHAVESFLDWFVTEQVEEEASTRAIAQQLKFLGEDRTGLFMVDRELATRVFTPPDGTAA